MAFALGAWLLGFALLDAALLKPDHLSIDVFVGASSFMYFYAAVCCVRNKGDAK